MGELFLKNILWNQSLGELSLINILWNQSLNEPFRILWNQSLDDLSQKNILWNQSLGEISLISVLLAQKKPETQKNTKTSEETKILSSTNQFLLDQFFDTDTNRLNRFFIVLRREPQ